MFLSPQLLLQEIFSEMVIKKNASLVSHDHHPDFILETNSQKQSYQVFAEGPKKLDAADAVYGI